MEALAAVGLASNIVQFISFTRDLISTTRSISHNVDGELVENTEIETVARTLLNLSGGLDASKNPSRRPIEKGKYAGSEEEEVLYNLCDKCREISGLLLDKIQSLKVKTVLSGKTEKQWISFRQALSSVLATGKIRDLEMRLDRYQKTIDTCLLTVLRTQIAQAEDNRKNGETAMSHLLLGFMDQTKEWQANLINSTHQNHWKPENAHDVELFSRQLLDGAQFDKELLDMRRILSLLQFEQISDRQEAIKENHRRTFEWAYEQGRPLAQADHKSAEDEGDALPQWDSFLEWLQEDGNVYWITGKPGSGKSTLMKFLFNDGRTTNAASQWSGCRELVRAGFFFWNSGTTIQMSRMGLVQTLLFQCLSGRESLIPRLLPNRFSRYSLFGGDMRPWSWLELTNALKLLLSMEEYCFLLFIDGLDEFDGDPQDLISLVLDLRKISPRTIKFCVASRPWLVFEESFQNVPWLRMEDLTRPDIQLYVGDKLRNSPRWNHMQSFMPKASADIVQDITNKADGVFLWVTLVMASLLDGIRDGDDLEDLWRRTDALPRDLEELFQRILSDIDTQYVSQSCEMFQLATAAMAPLSLRDMFLASDGCEKALMAPILEMTHEELAFRAETMRRRVISRSKGLLEVRSAPARLTHMKKVEFLHRTVRDYFQSENAQAYIQAGAPHYQPSLLLSASFMRQVKMQSRYIDESAWDGFWIPFVQSLLYLEQYEDSGDAISIQIVDELADTGQKYWNLPPLGSFNHGTWYAELFASTDRWAQPAWMNLQEQLKHETQTIARRSGTGKTISGKELANPPLHPHWTNSIHIAHLTSTSNSSKFQHSPLLALSHSFFDLALSFGLNFYVAAKLTPQLVHEGRLRGHSLLVYALKSLNCNVMHHLLKNGADPTERYGDNTSHVTVWQALLSLIEAFNNEKLRTELCELAVAFVEHGADLSKIPLAEFDLIFGHMKEEEKELLRERVVAARPKFSSKFVYKAFATWVKPRK
ncbi:hypothetical protein CC80DRAFT_507092 [Byssothecium circinans]|uniref:Uncharacterized protein n=1 Tax=Byssothecium circinans TaxID=147558 RepID=A0A6A5TXB5_9PLEO|nr:hypothetical protein CC80DRAFT_507092 [Byssothecium circinans]